MLKQHAQIVILRRQTKNKTKQKAEYREGGKEKTRDCEPLLGVHLSKYHLSRFNSVPRETAADTNSAKRGDWISFLFSRDTLKEKRGGKDVS